MKKIIFIYALVFALALPAGAALAAPCKTGLVNGTQMYLAENGCTISSGVPSNSQILVLGPGGSATYSTVGAYRGEAPAPVATPAVTNPTSSAAPAGGSTGGNAPPPIDSSLPGSPEYQAQNPGAGGGADHANDPSSNVQCGSAATGGALSTAAQSAGAGGNAKKCLESVGMNIAGNVVQSGGGSVSGAASGALSCLGGFVGSDVLLQCMSGGKCDGKTIANALIAIGMQRLLPKIQAAIMKQLGSVLSKSTAAAVSDVLDHAANITEIGNFQDFTNVAGVAGAVAGGGEVPVKDKTTHELVDEHGKQNDADNALLIKKTCVDDPTVANLHAQTADKINAEIIKEGQKYIVENYGDAEQKVIDEASKRFLDNLKDAPICSSQQSQLQEQIAQIIEQQGKPSTTQNAPTQNACTESESGDKVGWDGFLVDMATSPTLSWINAVQDLSAMQEHAAEELEHQIEDGRFAKGTCPSDPNDPNSAPKEGSPDECGDLFKAVVPAVDIGAAVQGATASGIRQLENAKNTGEQVNPMVVNLVNQLMSSLFGYLSLSISSGGNDSYLDQISGNSDASSVDTAKNYLTSALTNDIALEGEYQQTLTGMLADLNTGRSAFEAVRQCYVGLANKTIGLSTADIKLRTEQASTTVKAIFDPQILARGGELADSQAVVGELGRLKTQAEQATTAEEVNAVADALDALRAAGLVHGTADVSALADNASAAADAITTAVAEAALQLTECQSYTP